MAQTPQRLFQSGNIYIVVEDGATPFFNAAQSRANLLARQVSHSVSKIFTDRISKGFDEGSARARPNTRATLDWKRYYGKGALGKPLIATGALENAIKHPEVSMSESTFQWLNPTGTGTTDKGAGKSIVTVQWTLPTADQNVYLPEFQVRKNPDFVYLWSQEFGAPSRGSGEKMYKFGIKAWGNFRVPKRAFLLKALKQAMRDSLESTTTYINGWVGWMKSQEYKGIPGPDLGMEREFRWGPRDLVMIAAPPSMMYAGIGGGLDYFNILRGEFSVANYQQWIIQMTKGQAGATRLTQRRYIRKQLWK